MAQYGPSETALGGVNEVNLTESYLLLIVMVAVVAVASVFFKSRLTWVTPVIFLACAIVTLVAGMGVKIREITEGPFAFLDNSMQVLCGAAFCCLLYKNGTFEYIFNKITAKKRGAVLQLMLLVLFIALPGMITGSALVCVATTGLMTGKYLLDKGVENAKVVEVVSVGSLIGMILPPLCLPAILSVVGRQGSYPGSYEGFFLLTLIAALPALIVYCVMAGSRIVGDVEADASVEQKGSAVCLVPLLVAAVLVICHNFLYTVVPFLGYPLIYTIGFLLAIVLKAKGANPVVSAADGIRAAAPEVALMCAFGAASETLTLVGTNGTVSAQMLLLGTDVTVYALALMAVVLILGIALGPVMGMVGFGAFATYIISNGVYSNGCGAAMLGLGLVFCVVYFAAMRGGIVDQTGEALGVSGVSSKAVLSKTWVPVALLVVMAVIYFVARSSCSNLMI